MGWKAGYDCTMNGDLDWHLARAMLEWQSEMGVDVSMGEQPVDRFAVSAEPVKQSPASIPQPPPQIQTDPVADARAAAEASADLQSLQQAMSVYPHCELRLGARSLVFCDGVPGARVMILGEAPGRDEDRQGKPFVGRAGQLLDRMLAAIDLDRRASSKDQAVYITNVLPWRPPQNRDPRADEIAMLMPFVERHIALAKPEVLVLMGNTPCQAVLKRRGITRLRGQWTEAFDVPVLPMLHPAYLLRNPAAKREAWADLLELRARLVQ